MKKFNTSPISGMMELSPELQAKFNQLKTGISEVYSAHGFLNIETPTIDRTEILLAKAGGDTEKQIYKVVKTAEASDDADQALRFDHTVPLARYTVEHMNDLAFPFKVYQIGRNFRGERAQKGRFREFYQCDVDVIGWNSLPIAYDADIITTLIDAIRLLPLPGFTVRVSNRKLLGGLLEELNLQHLSDEIFNIVDHAEKVSAEKTVEALTDLGLGDDNVVKITTFIQIRGERREVIPKLEALNFENASFKEGMRELEEVLRLVERKVAEVTTADNGPSVTVEADMLIVRGLDYYTGTVFETIVPEYREIGSICSGGRYENLAKNYTDQPLPGVGGSIGLTRLFYVLQSNSLIKSTELKPVDTCIIPLSMNEFSAAEALATKLRNDGETVSVVLTDRKLGDKLNYASKIANSAIIVGESEVQTNTYVRKDLETGEQTPVKF